MAERHVSDYTKESQQILLDLINHDNGTTLTADKIVLENPTPTGTGTEVTVTVRSAHGSGFSGAVEMTYRRVDLDEVPNALDPVDYEWDLSNISGVLEFVGTHFGVNLQPSDVTVEGIDLENQDPPISQEYDVPQQFTLTAKPGSLVWVGNISLSIQKTRVDLSDVWQITVLDGLNPPSNGFPWPAGSHVSVGTDGNVRTRPDGSIRLLLVAQP